MARKRYIVTGGGGFVGRAICLALRSRGYEVISLSRGSYPELEAHGIITKRVDLTKDPEIWSGLFDGIDGVFHVAAKVEMWGRYFDFYEANVIATRNVIGACLSRGVSKLVFTSSPSVVADGRDLKGVDESYPYPHSHTAHYPATKAIAEREVLAANGERLATISLRPHLIWGPGDTNLVPTILERARKGKLVRVGRGENLTDLTYIEDCVEAHLLAMKALEENPAARGRAYFISQGDPVNMWGWIDDVLVRNGLPRVQRSVSKRLAQGLAALLEGVSKLLPGQPEPMLTRFLVCEMSTSHYFDIGAARKELGYRPSCRIGEALDRTFGEREAA